MFDSVRAHVLNILDNHRRHVWYMVSVSILYLFAAFAVELYLVKSSCFPIYIEGVGRIASIILDALGVTHSSANANTMAYKDLIYTPATATVYLNKTNAGLHGIAVLVIALICWRGPWLVKFSTVLAGSCIVYFLNGLRIALWLAVEQYHPLWSQFAQNWLIATAYFVCIAAIFFLSIKFFEPRERHKAI